MIDYKLELKNIFDTPNPLILKQDFNREIILYGAGSLGSMAVAIMSEKDMSPKYIVDKTKTGNLGAFDIISPENISHADKENALFLICIATLPYNEIEDYLLTIGCKNIMHFYTYAYLTMPELLENGWFKTDLIAGEKESIEKVCKALRHDEKSLAHFLQFLWWRIKLKEVIYKGFPVLSGRKYFNAPVFFGLGEHEALLDGGAHFGQTIAAFIEETQNRYDKIYVFEPDVENLGIARQKFNDQRIIFSGDALSDKTGICSFRDGLGYASKIEKKGSRQIKSVAIDDLDIKPTIIKLHIEGAELNALEGAKKTIDETHPVLMVLADHSGDGLYKIPLFILNCGYNLYFYLHDYCGNTAIWYGVQKQ